MHCAQKNKTRRRTHIDFPCFVSYIATIQTIAVSSNSYFYYTLITYKNDNDNNSSMHSNAMPSIIWYL